MHIKRSSRLPFAALVCLGFTAPTVRALVSLNDGRSKIFVASNVSFAWDSNLYYNKEGKGDYVMSAGVSTEYSRRAGLIGVDASISVNAAKHNKFTSEDFGNPSCSIEFTKQTGRTVGSLGLHGARESRADSDANMRSESWNYGADLNLRYPVIERYSLSGGMGFSKKDYTNNAALVDATSYSTNLDLFYMYATDRDLLAGYRYRHEISSASSTHDDNAFTLGLSGKILSKLNGSLRAGYQYRVSNNQIRENFESWTGSAATTWNYSKRISITGSFSKDFSTTATNISTDMETGVLTVGYVYSARWSLSASAGQGTSRFLGVDGGNRRDEFVKFDLSLNYSLNEHFHASASYAFFQNWSTTSYADFVRQSYSLTFGSRW